MIVIDDGSRDATAAIARRAGARVVSTAHRGAGHARRVGTEAARGRVVVYCDADEFYAADFLEHLTAPIVAGVSRRTFPGQVEWPNRHVGLALAWAWVRGHRDGRPPAFGSRHPAPRAVLRADVLAAGGYPVVGYGEDAELGRLLGEADVVGEARFAFTLPTGAAEVFRKSRWIGRGPRFARERPPLWHLSPPFSLLRAARLLAGGHARPAFVHLLYDAGRLIGFCERRLRPHVAAVA